MPEEGATRRQFLARTAAAVAGFGSVLGLLRAASSAPAYVPPDIVRRGLIRPPGALKEEGDFLARCLRCEVCAAVCETGAIRLAPASAGAAAGTPFLVCEEAACDLCLKCGQACPSGALEALSDRKQVRMGVAVVDKRSCVSHNGTGVCGACHTICPLKGTAITQGFRNAPKIDERACVGCGLCEEACIVDDPLGGRAIRVRSARGWA